MSDNLKKVTGLMNNSDLTSRVGAAMFMYARNFDLTAEDSNEKQFVLWVLKNPMSVDRTMLALIATTTTVLDNSEFQVEEPVISATGKQAGSVVIPVIPIPLPLPLIIDAVTDETISTAVADNWSLVAANYAPRTASGPSPMPGVVSSIGVPNPYLQQDTEPDPTEAPSPPTK